MHSLQTLRSSFLGLVLCCMWLSILSAGGCNTASDSSDNSASQESADQILSQMVAAYRQAKSYADSGDAYFSAYRQGTLQADQPLSFSTTFERPAKARLHLVDSTIVIDGEHLRAFVHNAPGQILQLPAPNPLSFERLPNDPILQEALNRGLPILKSWPLILLTHPDPLAPLLAGAKTTEMLEAESQDGHLCHRILAKSAEEERILWVDQESSLLRRIDFAGAELQRMINADGELKNLQVRLEFKGAQFDPGLNEDAFAFEVPGGSRLVKRFVPPVVSIPPAVGQKVGDFSLPTNSEPLRRGHLIDKVSVFCFWSVSQDVCRGVLPELELLAEKYKARPEVQFFAVSEDPSVVTAEKLLTTLRGWGSTLPILRDLDGAARAAMYVEGVPTVVVVGGDGRIHDFQPGIPLDTGAVDRAIAGLLSGDDVAKHLIDDFDEKYAGFRKELEQVSVVTEGSHVDVPLTVIAPKSDPSFLELEELWKAPEIKEPGNILIVPGEGDTSTALVFDGWRALVELDSSGQTIARHELDITEKAITSYLRTAVDGEGKRWYVTSSVNQQQCFLLDDQFQTTLKYPEERNPGIADVRLADLAGKGKLEIVVGYWGAAGVQGVSLEGERKWSNRTIENVLQILISSKDDEGRRKALCYSTSGTFLPINDQGEAGLDIRIPGRTLSSVAAEDVNGDGAVDICALAVDVKQLGRFTAIGLNEDGKELWSYELPPGNHNYMIERIVPARLGKSDGGWLLPAADGSIHLLTVTGELVDKFDYGAPLTGLSMAWWNDSPVLLVSTPDSFTTWRLTPPDSQ